MARTDGESLDVLTDRIVGIVRRLMAQQSLPGEPALGMSLGETGLGFDSMSRLDLLAAVEAECGVSIPEQYWGTKRFKDLAHLIKVVAKQT